MNKRLNSQKPDTEMRSYDFRALSNNFRFERWNFRFIHGYKLNLFAPKSFSEKIVFKKIFDRNPLLPIIADKLRARGFVRDRLGKSANDILIPLLWSGTNLDEIPFDTLPDQFVVKANHGSRMNHIVCDKTSENFDAIRAKCKKWLNKSFGVRRNEWCYQPIQRQIVIEQLLQNELGKIPSDFKFYMFDGKLGLIEVIADRFDDRSAAYFDQNMKPIALQNGSRKSIEINLPEVISKMITIAQKLSKGLDHIRVDLYELNGAIYFGEMTNYNASGRVAFKPREIDFWLGEKWNLDMSHLRTDISPSEFERF